MLLYKQEEAVMLLGWSKDPGPPKAGKTPAIFLSKKG